MRKTNFGYKLFFFISLAIALTNMVAKGYEGPFDNDDPAPEDTTKSARDTSLKFPIYDHSGISPTDNPPKSIDLQDPPNIKRSVEYDDTSKRYYFNERLSDRYLNAPNFMTLDEYSKYRAKQDEEAYWKRRMDALSLFNKKPELPTMYREGLFDRIFGGSTISVRPQGNVDVTFGGNWQHIQNPTLPQRAQKYGIFDFDMQMNINLIATVGDKLKLNISNNTKATFDYQNIQRLEYTGKEDEIIKKIEAGNISFPLKSSLITGVQSLFGLKTQLQFGKLWITAAVAQQRSKRQSVTIQGGSQTQQFAIKADDYEDNKHFLLAQYFHDNYNNALRNYPIINSQVTINKIEVWVTNRTGATEGVRTVYAFLDLGEKNPMQSIFSAPGSIPYGLPDNNANSLYSRLQQNPLARVPDQASSAIQTIGDLKINTDFVNPSARKLTPSEFTYNTRLGYISLNTQLNPEDVLAVAYRYTYNGKVYQVGEFAEDLPPLPNNGSNTTDQRVLFLKLLKGTSNNPRLPTWNLMMKNIYALGGLGVSKDEFRLNVLYQDPGGGEKRYLPEGPLAGRPLISILNLDRLNIQGDPVPDGIFDFVEGITINTQQGKVIFPVLEPFGSGLDTAVGNSQLLQRKYQYRILYDSTKTVAKQFQQNNRFVIKGSYKSSSSSEIFLGGFNIPQGSVSVTAGGQKLTENVDYQIDYGLGKLKILNTGILNSGIPINVQYEDNATFGFQQQNFTGLHAEYFFNRKLSLGGTYMKLAERPFTQKTTFGDDPIKNTVLGLDGNYQSEVPGLTRILDKLPVYSTTAPSLISVTGEVASLLPGHAKQINSLDPEGSVYIDDFEGTKGSYDLKFPANSWTLASTPSGATNKAGKVMFPEADDLNKLSYGKNRARLAWYFIEPTLVDPSTGVPDNVKKDPNQHYIRLIQQQDVFPNKSNNTLQNALSTLDLAYYPKERGPYNFDPTALDADGKLTNPADRWAGIMRPIDNSDFEQSNVEFIEFWVMDPFIHNTTSKGGSLYINLGNISEDLLKDEHKFFENGITYPKDPGQLDNSVWGYQPKLSQQITRSFDNDPAARAVQDVGYDGLDNEDEKGFFANYLAQVANTVTNPAALQAIKDDPSGDDYHYFRGSDFDQNEPGVLGRYKKFNGPQGNSPVTTDNTAYSSASTTIPESEDINRDNTLNEAEDYYQYRIDLSPDMQVGSNYIVNTQVSNVKLPNGSTEEEKWYQFKVPIREFNSKIGNIADFRSIRFMRMFLSGFQDSVILRFAQLDLGRNNWRRYLFSLQNPGENIPEEDQNTVDFAVTSVSYEENNARQPVPYVIPPGVNRQMAAVSTGQNIQLNEQALSLQVCNLKDGDIRAVYKEVGVDMRQFGSLRMFIHAESRVGSAPLKDGDIRAVIRIGSDFTNNYYEYQMPLTITLPGTNTDEGVWPAANRLDLVLNDLVNVKTERNNKGAQSFIPYTVKDAKGNYITVVGNPNIGDAKTILLGIANPKKNTQSTDDGLPKCAEVWFNELRMTGLDEKAGYAASGKVAIQMADLGTVNLGGSMHTAGYGNIDQKLNQRFRDNFYQYNASTNLNVGKLMPRKWGVQLPVFVGYSQNTSNPQYDPYDLDVKYADKLDAARDAAQRDSIRKVAQDYTSITSVNLTNVRVLGNPEKQGKSPMPWSARNFAVSYAYNRQFKRNPTVESDDLTTHKIGLNYTYAIKSKPVEPFKKLIHSKSKWMMLVKDFNFKLLPSNFTFQTDINRTMDETKVRNLDADVLTVPTYYKNFVWSRQYTTRWELTRSLSFDYTATNLSRIDEPYGRINTAEKKDSLWNKILTFGRNTNYTQRFSATYSLPLQKLPLTDWTNLKLNYAADYTWTASSQLARSQGNILNNTQSEGVNLELQFSQLYNKNKWLRAVNQPKPNTGKKDDKNAPGPGLTGANNKLKDLRPGANNKDNSKKKKTTVAPADTSMKQFYDIEKNTAKLSDKQLDSVKKLQHAQILAQAKLDKEKRKKERKEARRKRREAKPEITDIERVVGRFLTMVKRTTVSVNETAGSTLPGWMDSTRFLGINTSSGAPGFGYVYGMQPDRGWLETQALAGRISADTLFNAQFLQNYQQTLNMTTTLEPIKDFRIDVTLTRTFQKSHSELFKDTTLTGNGVYTHNNPYETGSFSTSYIGIKTLFKGSDINSGPFRQFLDNRQTVSDRLSKNNPYSNSVNDPNDPNYKKGYTSYSQDVLVPAFIAAYTGRGADKIGLVDNNNATIKSNPFHNFLPMPNWRITYNGLGRIPALAEKVSNLAISSAYTGTLSMNSFVSQLYYQDVYSLGFPSFIDSNSGNFIPFYQVPNVTITEAFNPLFGVDAALKNGMSIRFDYRKSRNVSLSLVDYQVSETNSSEYAIGFGYRIHGLVLPFDFFGVKKLKNDLNIKVDVGLRDDKSSNNYLAQNLNVVTRGQKVVTISPSIDYIVSERLTLHFFYDRRQSIPYISTSYPTTTTRAGVTLRFIFTQ
ncbi:MAG: cell surface protein SprA [Bacteroidetes bacterium 43-93]|nr:cell surface protein SprA [Bacteroidota bacterium]OJW96448.1 MAG: cell surface protein SprA [Bacteroidetes bacterium 43-93]